MRNFANESDATCGNPPAVALPEVVPMSLFQDESSCYDEYSRLAYRLLAERREVSFAYSHTQTLEKKR